MYSVKSYVVTGQRRRYTKTIFRWRYWKRALSKRIRTRLINEFGKSACVAVQGFTIPHGHIHIIPTSEDSNVLLRRELVGKEELRRVRERIGEII